MRSYTDATEKWRAGTSSCWGPGNESGGARGRWKAYPGGMQIGGGINLDNAAGYLGDGGLRM